MIWRVLIIGGYGNFGRFIAESLAKENNIQLIIAGRSIDKAEALARSLNAEHPVECAFVDIFSQFAAALRRIGPHIVIHTSGPFQHQGYHVAKDCIDYGVHYIDLADGRDFVAGVTVLHESAKKKGVLVVSGASSVPCLTAALIDQFAPEFVALTEVDYGITTAQKTARGLATTAAILGYAGKPFLTRVNGEMAAVYGWQSLRARKYRDLGWRLLGNCDVPDLALFPIRYPELQTIRFYAGLEIPFIHCTLWVLSYFVRMGLIRNLEKAAPLLLRLSFYFDFLGSSESAFHLSLRGKGQEDENKEIRFELIARNGDGPYIPCMPSILLTKKIVSRGISKVGAYPCVGMINSHEYLDALAALNIGWHVETS